ncbi:uncharacterized protein B0P05DRAFT_565136 [Gilbertella persicaria]|uniref:uncharacterized protein n=1 Tax=Gilbertella persicaria TaxID=101096 RepID=UPI002221286D|nr:uncharacterized protein B0P05DRAFT_565136 [Gilbertella persicaria]KAI8047977.1 hypothetical protein B0P05DRAFT_565136 [Gilbertella persicaria]
MFIDLNTCFLRFEDVLYQLPIEQLWFQLITSCLSLKQKRWLQDYLASGKYDVSTKLVVSKPTKVGMKQNESLNAYNEQIQQLKRKFDCYGKTAFSRFIDYLIKKITITRCNSIPYTEYLSSTMTSNIKKLYAKLYRNSHVDNTSISICSSAGAL